MSNLRAPQDASPSKCNQEIYQYSVLSALVAGAYSADVGTFMSHLQEHGNFGLGTFVDLDGEMVMLDGVPYRILYNGNISIVSSNTLLTYATLTTFPAKVDHRFVVESDVCEKHELQKIIDQIVPYGENYFLALKISGVFARIKMRAARALTAEQSFRDVADTQRVEDVVDSEGTMIGFRAPMWTHGVTMAGFHLHFITSDKKKGGHILEYEARKGVVVEVVVCQNLNLELPKGVRYQKADLRLNENDISKVQGK